MIAEKSVSGHFGIAILLYSIISIFLRDEIKVSMFDYEIKSLFLVYWQVSFNYLLRTVNQR